MIDMTDNAAAMERDKMIDRYLRGEMSREEEAMFIARLEDDAELRSDAIVRARLARGMRQADNELIEAMKNASEHEVMKAAGTRRRGLRPVAGWLAAVCVAAVAAVGGYRVYDRHNVTQLGGEYAQAFPLESMVRGESEADVETELTELLGNVVNRVNLTATTARLAELWRISNDDTYNCYTDYAPYIGWYLATGYLANYNKAEGKAVLQEIIGNEDFPEALRQMARELLGILNGEC